MVITPEQARALASAIYDDIHSFIVNHEEEYQARGDDPSYCDEQNKADQNRLYIIMMLAIVANRVAIA